MCMENSCIFRPNGLCNALLHIQNLHARLNKGRFKAPYFVRDLGMRDAVTNDVIQVIAHDMNLGTGHSRRDAYSFKPDFLVRAVAHAPARVKQMSNNANSVDRIVALRRPDAAAPRPTSILVKTRLDQCLKFFHRLVGVRTFATDVQLRPLPGSEHHQTHNAFAIYHFPLLRYPDFRAVTTRNSHEHGRGSRVESKSIRD